jgi:hypothetical protein
VKCTKDHASREQAFCPDCTARPAFAPVVAGLRQIRCLAPLDPNGMTELTIAAAVSGMQISEKQACAHPLFGY